MALLAQGHHYLNQGVEEWGSVAGFQRRGANCFAPGGRKPRRGPSPGTLGALGTQDLLGPRLLARASSTPAASTKKRPSFEAWLRRALFYMALLAQGHHYLNQGVEAQQPCKDGPTRRRSRARASPGGGPGSAPVIAWMRQSLKVREGRGIHGDPGSGRVRSIPLPGLNIRSFPDLHRRFCRPVRRRPAGAL